MIFFADAVEKVEFKRVRSCADPFDVPVPFTNRTEHTLSGHQGPVLCFATLGDTLLFSGSADCTIKVHKSPQHTLPHPSFHSIPPHFNGDRWKENSFAHLLFIFYCYVIDGRSMSSVHFLPNCTSRYTNAVHFSLFFSFSSFFPIPTHSVYLYHDRWKENILCSFPFPSIILSTMRKQI